MKVVKEVETTTGKLSRGEETLGHVLVGKGSEVLPFHLNEVDIVDIGGCLFPTWTKDSQEKGT